MKWQNEYVIIRIGINFVKSGVSEVKWWIWIGFKDGILNKGWIKGKWFNKYEGVGIVIIMDDGIDKLNWVKGNVN